MFLLGAASAAPGAQEPREAHSLTRSTSTLSTVSTRPLRVNAPASSPDAAAAVTVRAAVAGSVAAVRVSPGQSVAAGAVLVALDPVPYRSRMAAAQRRLAEAEARARRALDALAAQERMASLDVGVAVAGARAVPRPGPDARGPLPDPATTLAVARAARRMQAAQAELVRVLRAQTAAARETVDRDRPLLAQGAIPAEQLSRDQAAYRSLSVQTEAAADALRRAGTLPAPAAPRNALAGSPVAPAVQGVSAQAVAEAQKARTLAAAAQQAVDRDKALLAEGAIPAKQLETDTNALDAARARAEAADAAVRQQEARRAAAEAARRQIDAARRAAAAQAKNAAAVEARARHAEATILQAERHALELDTAQHDVMDARAALAAAERGLDAAAVRAPAESRIAGVLVRAGETVAPGQPLLSLAVPYGVPHSAPMSAAPGGQPDGPGRGPIPAAPAGRTDAGRAGPAAPETVDPVALQEQRLLARLQQESMRIQAIIVSAGSAPRAGPVPAYLGDGLAWPVAGWVSSAFGWRLHPIFHTPEFHTGIDIAAAQGTPVEAGGDGRVIFTGWMPANGNLVILDHGAGLSTTYSHLSSISVRAGDRVRKGQIIAAVGSTGWSTGPHLFFEVRQHGRPVDPLRP
jgi:murein DD-endopeptidase MepM/ murein hydrolase activator NlpD